MDLLMKEEPGAGSAALARIRVDREERSVHGFLQVGIRENDVGTLAAEFQRNVLDRFGGARHDPASGFGFPGERDLVDQRMPDERIADFLAGSRQHIDDAIGDSGFPADFAEHDGCQWRDRCGLENDRVSGGDGRRDFPGRHQQREVPRDNLRANADRLAEGVVEQRPVQRDLLAPELGS